MIGLYAEHIVRLADKGGKNAQNYVLSFFDESLKFKTLDEIWRDVAHKIPGQDSDVCPDEDGLLVILKENAHSITPDLKRRVLTQFQNFQLRKAIINGILNVHGASADITEHYGLQKNIYGLIWTSLQKIENAFLRSYSQYVENGNALEMYAKKEASIQSFLSNRTTDAQAAIHNFLATRTRNILQSAQQYNENAAVILKNMEGQETVFRSFSHIVSPHIQNESAKLLLTIYDARLMRDLHKRNYGKSYILYQDDEVKSGEVTQMLPPTMNPNWKLAEVTGVLRDESFDPEKALDFIHFYALQGYREAQEALARFSAMIKDIEAKSDATHSSENKDSTQGASLEQLFHLYNAKLIS